MLIELLRAFFLIFVAEMGDKSQILAMSFATKYKLKHVVIGLSIGIFLNHALAILLGSNLKQIIPLTQISFVAGLLFILFGLMSLNIDEEEAEVKTTKWGPIITVAIAFFLGELGDKTQLTAIFLASDATYPAIILVGTVLGMIFTSLLGIFIGIKLGSKIPEATIKIVSSFIFLLFGIQKAYVNLPDFLNTNTYILVLGIITILIYTYFLTRFILISKKKEDTRFTKTARELKFYYDNIKKHLDSICHGEKHCGVCEQNQCLLGYTKDLIQKALNDEEIDLTLLENAKVKNYSKTKLKQALDITLESLKDNWTSKEYEKVHIVRNNLEILLYGKKIEAKTYEEYKKSL